MALLKEPIENSQVYEIIAILQGSNGQECVSKILCALNSSVYHNYLQIIC